MLKGGTVTRDFYPFVEKDLNEGLNKNEQGTVEGTDHAEETCEVQHPARVAVYDDASAAPRVVVIEPTDVRSYLEEITSTVNRLSHEQGGNIPFMVIREIVENFIHAYFQAPTITILDGGNTIRFSDQGPGIKEKSLALEYGTSSATEDMKRYIRGVGSGLPYVQQYMVDKGGSLEIEDNIAGGTVVTISTHPLDEARSVSGAGTDRTAAPASAAAAEQPFPQVPQQAWGQAPFQPMPYQTPYYQQGAYYPQAGAQPVAAGTAPGAQWPVYQQPAQQLPPQQAAPQAPVQQATPQQPAPVATPTPQQPFLPGTVTLDERVAQALSYLAEHGSAGPTDLVHAYGLSGPTWSRTLSNLAAQGLVLKNGQKYQLTTIGRSFSPLG